jgi:hypothetical protein
MVVSTSNSAGVRWSTKRVAHVGHVLGRRGLDQLAAALSIVG